MNPIAKAGLTAVILTLAQTTNFAFAAPSSLPPLQHQGDIDYLSGGVGSDQSAALKDAMRKYPLALEFTGKTHHGNEYLSDIPVEITDMHGAMRLNATARGPFMLASLPGGRYKVTASYRGKTQQRVVDITSSARVRTLFLWPTNADGSES